MGDERQRDDRERARDSEKKKRVAVIHKTACQERKTCSSENTELDILPQGAPEGAQALTGPVTDQISLVVKVSVLFGREKLVGGQ